MSFDSSLPDGAGGDKVDQELQAFIQMESEKAKFQAQIHNYTDVCWEKCVDKPGKNLDGKTEACLQNCVERFIDTTLFIAERFQKNLSQKSGH